MNRRLAIAVLLVGCGGNASTTVDGSSSNPIDAPPAGGDPDASPIDAPPAGGDPDASPIDAPPAGGDPDGGDGPDDLRINRSGTRLKMRVGTTPDGARTFLGWHDLELDTDCQFMVAADDQTRCMPISGVDVTYFADSGCTQPVGWRSRGSCNGPAPRYARKFGTCGSDGYALSVYPITGTSDATTVYYGVPGNCVAIAAAQYELFTVGAELPPATFQPLTESLE